MDMSYIMLSDTYPVEFPLKINIAKSILSYLSIVVLILITFKKNNLLTSYLFRVLTFFTMIPLSSVYAMKDESSAFFFITCSTYLVVQWVFINNHKETGRTEAYISDTKSVKTLRLSCLAFLVLTTILMFLQLGFPSLGALVLENVYDIRQNLHISNYVRYMLWVCAQVIVPFGIADGYVRKNKIQILLCILCQLMFYLWTGNKTWFFAIFLISAIMFLLFFKMKLDYFLVGVTVLCAFGYYGNENVIGMTVGSFLNRRVLLDPAALKFSYYDYFIVNSHEPVLFSSTVLGPVFRGICSSSNPDFPYDISNKYTDKASNAVTGIYGGDLANWSWFTFLIVPIALYFLAVSAEKTKYRIGSSFAYIFLTYLFFSFNDQRIVQFLLDFQGILLILILYIMSNKTKNYLAKQ